MDTKETIIIRKYMYLLINYIYTDYESIAYRCLNKKLTSYLYHVIMPRIIVTVIHNVIIIIVLSS